MIEELLGFDPAQVLQRTVELARNPAIDPQASLLLLAVIVLLAMIALASAVIVVLGRSAREARRSGGVAAGADGYSAHRAPHRFRFPVAGALVTLGAIAVMWVAAGYSTSGSDVCRSCHTGTNHYALRAELPHSDTACVRCHESGGVPAELTIGLPGRLIHIGTSLAKSDRNEYGHIQSSACQGCHRDDIAVTTENVRRGIRVSHVEPLEAGARCLTCHRPNAEGVIAGSYGGMNTCLPCHDSRTVAADCDMCHTRDYGYPAVADRHPRPETARVLVPNPTQRCYTCHAPQPCDSCHGTRLPHDDAFMAGDHAYEGARSIWLEDGGECAACHTDRRNSCSKAGCHGDDFPHHFAIDKNFPRTHATGRWIRTGPLFDTPSNLGCSTCHRLDMCETMCHEYRPTVPLERFGLGTQPTGGDEE
jgi:hypothetical protein